MEIYISTIMVLVAAIVAWTNYQQHLLTKEKFKLDLFEKRFAVYKGVQRFLTHILLKAKIELDKLNEFRGDTQDAVFLFCDDIPKYLGSIDRKALDMWTKAEQYKDLPVREERSKLCKEESRLLMELLDELPRLKDVFAPYLKFKTWK
jgi:hypothetical protein